MIIGGDVQILLQTQAAVGNLLGKLLAKIPDVPRFIHITGDILLILRVSDDEAVFPAVLGKPLGFRGVGKGAGG